MTLPPAPRIPTVRHVPRNAACTAAIAVTPATAPYESLHKHIARCDATAISNTGLIHVLIGTKLCTGLLMQVVWWAMNAPLPQPAGELSAIRSHVCAFDRIRPMRCHDLAASRLNTVLLNNIPYQSATISRSACRLGKRRKQVPAPSCYHKRPQAAPPLLRGVDECARGRCCHEKIVSSHGLSYRSVGGGSDTSGGTAVE